MTDETTATDLPADLPTEAPAPVATISEAIAARLSGVAPLTREKVIDHFAQKLATKQADALIVGLDKLDGLNKENYKLKADQIVYNAGGTPISEGFSKARLDERKKLGEQIEKLSKAIDKADAKGDFADLYNLTK